MGSPRLHLSLRVQFCFQSVPACPCPILGCFQLPTFFWLIHSLFSSGWVRVVYKPTGPRSRELALTWLTRLGCNWRVEDWCCRWCLSWSEIWLGFRKLATFFHAWGRLNVSRALIVPDLTVGCFQQFQGGSKAQGLESCTYVRLIPPPKEDSQQSISVIF